MKRFNQVGKSSDACDEIYSSRDTANNAPADETENDFRVTLRPRKISPGHRVYGQLGQEVSWY